MKKGGKSIGKIDRGNLTSDVLSKKRLIYSIICVFTLTLFVLLIVNHVYETKVLAEKSFERNYLSFIRGLNNGSYSDISIISLGDSHTQAGFDPREVPNSYNFGIGTENYVKDYFMFKKILALNTTFKVLLLENDMQELSSSLVEQQIVFNDAWFFKDQFDASDIALIRNKSYVSAFVRSFVYKYLPVVNMGRNLVYTLAVAQNPREQVMGFVPDNRVFTQRNETQLMSEYYSIHYQGKSLDNALEKTFFLKIAQTAKENNITLILLRYPYSSQFASYLESHGVNRTNFNQNVENLLYANNISFTILDYYRLFENESQLFYDPDHINAQGASLFSKEIARDLEKLNAGN